MAKKTVSSKGSQAGFTVIEMMITLVIAALLLSMAIPSLRDLMIRNRLSSRVNELVGSLQLARSESVKRGVPITVCKRSGTSCGGDWNQGWIVFVDTDSDGDTDVGEVVIFTSENNADGFVFDNAVIGDTLIYRADGSASVSGDFTLCYEKKYATKVDISFLGSPRTEKLADPSAECP